MSVDKIVLRAFLTTLASVAILFLFMITALVCVYPQTMMKLTDNLGMENASIWFAEVSYNRTDDVYYLAYATEVAIGQEDYQSIDNCGKQLIAHEGFDEFCEKKGDKSGEAEMTYRQYVCGQVCIAKYKCGNITEAVNLAFEVVEENAFPKNNAVVAVLLTALQNGDAETVELIRGKMIERQDRMIESDEDYFKAILALTENK